MINIKALLLGKRDEELVAIRSDAKLPLMQAENEYRSDGGISSELAQLASENAEVVTVAATIIKQRVENGGEGSHGRLQNTSVNISPKRIDRGWGKWLSDRRRV